MRKHLIPLTISRASGRTLLSLKFFLSANDVATRALRNPDATWEVMIILTNKPKRLVGEVRVHHCCHSARYGVFGFSVVQLRNYCSDLCSFLGCGHKRLRLCLWIIVVYIYLSDNKWHWSFVLSLLYYSFLYWIPVVWSYYISCHFF